MKAPFEHLENNFLAGHGVIPFRAFCVSILGSLVREGIYSA